MNSMRTAAIAAGVFFVLSSVSCMESIEPTPKSAVMSIVPANGYVTGDQTETFTRFLMPLVITNTGSRPVYLDLGYRRAEKLIDQKWELAIEQSAGNFVSVRIINPGRTVTINYVVAYQRGSTPPLPLLDHIRGLYRMRLRFSYTSNGTDPLPVEDSYSQPFAVTE